jgi:rhodanese-related sulfurtransferase
MILSLLASYLYSCIGAVSLLVSPVDTYQCPAPDLIRVSRVIVKEANKMKKGFKRLLAEAHDIIVTYSPAAAQTLLGDESVVFVDIRDLPELRREGKIPGAVHASRGMLEFLVDPESPYHKPVFASSKRFLLYCASGGRSALAAQRLQEMGLNLVAHIGGGLQAWKEAGGPVVDFQQAA